MMQKTRIKTGLDHLLEEGLNRYRGSRAALLVNPTSVDAHLRHSIDLLISNQSIRIVRLFSPEDGIYADAQDMIMVNDTRDPVTGLPVFSLYGASTIPALEQVQDLDLIIYDIQDVARYHFICAIS